jgi:hypothetical protein
VVACVYETTASIGVILSPLFLALVSNLQIAAQPWSEIFEGKMFEKGLKLEKRENILIRKCQISQRVSERSLSAAASSELLVVVVLPSFTAGPTHRPHAKTGPRTKEHLAPTVIDSTRHYHQTVIDYGVSNRLTLKGQTWCAVPS